MSQGLPTLYKQILVNGNGTYRITIPKGYNFLLIENPTAYSVEVYNSISDLIIQNRIAFCSIYTILPVRLPMSDDVFRDYLISYTGAGADKITVQILQDNPGPGQTLISPGGSSSVVIAGDSVGLARSANFPSSLSGGGNFRVAVMEFQGALPAGGNAIGTVGVTALPALPAGANAIGTVGVTALPALPAGANAIGTVGVTSTVNPPALDANMSSLISTLQGFYAAISIDQTSAAAALTTTLDTGAYGGRSNLEVYVSTDNAGGATFNVYGSKDNVNWRLVDSIVLSAAGYNHKGYLNGYRYIQVSTTIAANNEIEIVASR